MSTEAPKYAVYDLRSYFVRAPRHIQLCPACGYWINRWNIDPSRSVADTLTDDQLIPVHDLSVVYVCEKCFWWAVRESWGMLEWGTSYDYLILCTEQKPGAFDITDEQTLPWNGLLKDPGIYQGVLPLPDSLGQLFVGGTAKEDTARETEQASTQAPQKSPSEQLALLLDTEEKSLT